MSDHTTRPGLRADFPAHTFEQWKEAAVTLLEGASYDKRLRTPLPEGITLEPLYRADDVAALKHRGSLPGQAPFVRGPRAAGYAKTRWLISQELAAETPQELAVVAREALARGQDELNLSLEQLPSLAGLDTAFEGIDLTQTSVFLRSGALALPATAALLALAERRGVPSDALRGCIGADPLGVLVSRGSLPCSLEQAFRDLALATRHVSEHAGGLQTIAIDGLPYRDAGGSTVQELGYVLANAVEVLRTLRLAGLSVEEIAPRLRFCLGLGSNLFVEIAKLRAARLLWSRVLEAYGVPEEKRTVHLHARTARWNTTSLDPHVNLLRGTTEAFSAIVGNVDSLCVAPFDEALGATSDFSRRVARNTQLVLAEECELTHVADPAGGSWYIEWLTDKLAREAWTLFQGVETQGGLAQALRAGGPQKAVADVAAAQREALAERRSLLIGTNVYPLAKERPQTRDAATEPTNAPTADAAEATHETLERFRQAPEVGGEDVIALACQALEGGATLVELTPRGDALRVDALPQRRLAADFEDLRQAASAYAEEHGHAPRVLQANIGASRGYRARADWTSGFFQVGGFEVLAGRDFETAAEAAEALRDSGTAIAVLTASDETYARELPGAAQTLRTALPAAGTLLLAGAPADETKETAWRKAGVEIFVNVRVNTYELLAQLLRRIEALS